MSVIFFLRILMVTFGTSLQCLHNYWIDLFINHSAIPLIQAPNELLLFNLLSGRATQLRGHNTKIQATAFAVKGASIVSCGSNLLKVWDCITGSCLYTLGGDDHNSVGHTQKINAMAVNKWQSCKLILLSAFLYCI
jgi:WD40 repeat protein